MKNTYGVVIKTKVNSGTGNQKLRIGSEFATNLSDASFDILPTTNDFVFEGTFISNSTNLNIGVISAEKQWNKNRN